MAPYEAEEVMRCAENSTREGTEELHLCKLPIITYASETWAFRKKTTRQENTEKNQ